MDLVRWWKARSRRTQAWLVVVAVLGVGALLGGTGSRSAPAGSPTGSPVAGASSPTPPASPRSVATSSPGATQTASPAPEAIAGLAVVDVTKSLEQRGFGCEGPRQLATMASWTCRSGQGSRVEFVVEILGPGPTRVRSVNAGVTQSQAQPSDAIAAEFLGFIATVPYTDADPQRARAWVESNIARGDATLTIGSARFSLSRAATGRAHTLDIVAVGAR